MKVNRNHASNLRLAIKNWSLAGLLDESTANALQQSIEVQPFDWKRLAKYSFWVAIICIVSRCREMIKPFVDRTLHVS